MAFDQIHMLSLFLLFVRTVILVLVFCGTSILFSKMPIRPRVLTLSLLKKGKHKKQRAGLFPTLLLEPECQQEGMTARESMGRDKAKKVDEASRPHTEDHEYWKLPQEEAQGTHITPQCS